MDDAIRDAAIIAAVAWYFTQDMQQAAILGGLVFVLQKFM